MTKEQESDRNWAILAVTMDARWQWIQSPDFKENDFNLGLYNRANTMKCKSEPKSSQTYNNLESLHLPWGSCLRIYSEKKGGLKTKKEEYVGQ